MAGSGLSLAADQQVTTGVLWAIAACAFIPVIFWNLVVWLRSEEDPDQELHRLAKQERRRRRGNRAGATGGPFPRRPDGAAVLIESSTMRVRNRVTP